MASIKHILSGTSSCVLCIYIVCWMPLKSDADQIFDLFPKICATRSAPFCSLNDGTDGVLFFIFFIIIHSKKRINYWFQPILYTLDDTFGNGKEGGGEGWGQLGCWYFAIGFCRLKIVNTSDAVAIDIGAFHNGFVDVDSQQHYPNVNSSYGFNANRIYIYTIIVYIYTWKNIWLSPVENIHPNKPFQRNSLLHLVRRVIIIRKIFGHFI